MPSTAAISYSSTVNKSTVNWSYLHTIILLLEEKKKGLKQSQMTESKKKGTPTFIRCWSCEACFARALTSSGSTLDWGRITKSIGVASGLDACCLEEDWPDLGLHYSQKDCFSDFSIHQLHKFINATWALLWKIQIKVTVSRLHSCSFICRPVRVQQNSSAKLYKFNMLQ